MILRSSTLGWLPLHAPGERAPRCVEVGQSPPARVLRSLILQGPRPKILGGNDANPASSVLPEGHINATACRLRRSWSEDQAVGRSGRRDLLPGRADCRGRPFPLDSRMAFERVSIWTILSPISWLWRSRSVPTLRWFCLSRAKLSCKALARIFRGMSVYRGVDTRKCLSCNG